MQLNPALHRDAAKAFNIPRRTLQNYVQSGKTFKNLGRSSVLTAVQEKELCSRIVRFSDIGLPITPQVIKFMFLIIVKLTAFQTLLTVTKLQLVING